MVMLSNVDLRRHTFSALKRDQTWHNVMTMKRLTVDGGKLATCRELAGMTQSQLAKKLRVDRTSVAHWEAGRRFPAAPTFKRLCAALQVAADQLLASVDDEAGAA